MTAEQGSPTTDDVRRCSGVIVGGLQAGTPCSRMASRYDNGAWRCVQHASPTAETFPAAIIRLAARPDSPTLDDVRGAFNALTAEWRPLERARALAAFDAAARLAEAPERPAPEYVEQYRTASNGGNVNSETNTASGWAGPFPERPA